MTLGSKDHDETMQMFEKIFAGEFRLDKEDKSQWPRGFVYQHGDANRLFKAFRQGVAYGRATA